MSIGIITQARLSSTRLPSKVLRKIEDKTLLDYHLARLQKIGIPIFVAIPEEEPQLLSYLKSIGRKYFVGPTNDVLARFKIAAQEAELKTIIRVTSDCPLIDPDIMREGIENYLKLNSDSIYYSNCIQRTYPRGMDFEIFDIKQLLEANQNALTNHQREHVTPFIIENTNVKNVHHLNKADWSRYRLTVDTEQDLLLITKLISIHKADRLTCSEVVDLLRKNQDLVRINHGVKQKVY